MVDAELVAQALAGDAAGIAGIYDRYSDRIHDYARSMLRSDADAADVTQDTFLVGAQRLAQLRDPTKLRPWLYAIARSHALRVLRTRKRVESSDEVDSVFEMTATEGAIDAQRLVRAAADGLEDSDRDILDLHLRHGLEGQELAEAMGISANAANVALHRVRERFEQAATTVLLSAAPPGECGDFDQIVAPGLSPLVRKRVARHIDGCAVCQQRKKSTRPFALFAAIPLAAAPPGLRDQVLVAVGTGQGLTAASQLDWAPDGFPNTTPLVPGARASKPRTPSAPRLAFAGVGVAAALLLTFFAFRSGGDTTVDVASEAEITAVAAPIFEPTSTPSPEPAPTASPPSTVAPPSPTPTMPTATVVPPTVEPPTSSAPPPPTPQATPPTATATPTPTVSPTPSPTPTPTVSPTPSPTPTPTVSPTPTVVPLPVITPLSFACEDPMRVTVDIESTGPVTVVFEWTAGSASASAGLQFQDLTGYYKGTLRIPANTVVQPRVIATNAAGSTTYDDYPKCPDIG